MSHKEMINAMQHMDNGEKIEFLKYLYHEHFTVWQPTDDEVAVLRAFHDGELEGIDLDEYRY